MKAVQYQEAVSSEPVDMTLPQSVFTLHALPP